MGIIPAMFHITRFTATLVSAIALTTIPVSCNGDASGTLTSLFSGNSPEEHRLLSQQLQQSREAIARLDAQIQEAETLNYSLSYELEKRLSNQGKLTTPFTVKDIDKLHLKTRDFQYLEFSIKDMRNELANYKKEFHAIQYQYNAYAAKLEEFKKKFRLD